MNARKGLTLFEVVIALAIFLMSMAAIFQLIEYNTRSAFEVEQLTQASLHCQSKLAELASGAVPFESAGLTPLDDSAEWFCQVDVSEDVALGLHFVEVTVQHGDGDNPEVKVTLRQKMIEPAMRGSTHDASALAAGGAP